MVVGNPRRNSRTRDAAVSVAEKLTGAPPDAVLELGEIGPALLDGQSEAVQEAVDTVKRAAVVVVASPTYKAAYTGLLKLFLDLLPTGEGLRGKVVIPVMLGGGLAHALVADLVLKPVLVELGATTPAPGLFLLDSSYQSDGRVDEYAERWKDVVTS
ncbi:hypothetical protein AS9A_3910 [Hoyosella subflava DQS3-9A1]|uniref:NADPH-dependent FMN reductase-like domain-containing protein n=1 Tax=Hoyosella subflava (strain DSM 45089 / JCM 17490 / NBRC 109087 / DQS3-9A1) TaxID=443218 RepID=F6EHI2_HOYSD|nr:hypothetical protein AS9A_3910 [Hoyosella subflava DQS3-9A1]